LNDVAVLNIAKLKLDRRGRGISIWINCGGEWGAECGISPR
jgi:hypothetical protein